MFLSCGDLSYRILSVFYAASVDFQRFLQILGVSMTIISVNVESELFDFLQTSVIEGASALQS